MTPIFLDNIFYCLDCCMIHLSHKSSSGRGLKILEKITSCGRVTQGNVFKHGLQVSSDEPKEMFLKFVNANMSTSNVANMQLHGILKVRLYDIAM